VQPAQWVQQQQNPQMYAPQQQQNPQMYAPQQQQNPQMYAPQQQQNPQMYAPQQVSTQPHMQQGNFVGRPAPPGSSPNSPVSSPGVPKHMPPAHANPAKRRKVVWWILVSSAVMTALAFFGTATYYFMKYA
jgi:hypothetical protein